MYNKKYIFYYILILSLLLRLFLFFTVYSDLRHGSAAGYGSVAIGAYFSDGLTINDFETNRIGILSNNYSGNYLDFHSVKERKQFTKFLPGPAILSSLLWKFIPIYNFGPYIIFQALLESILIALFFLILSVYEKNIVLITVFFMIFNLAAIKRVLMMGYDFWPQFNILVTFIGFIFALQSKNKNNKFIYLLIGTLTAITFWFRSITIFLPLFIAIFLFLFLRNKTAQYQKVVRNESSHGLQDPEDIGPVLRSEYRSKYISIFTKITLYILPILISVLLLCWFRYETTGNIRPTRSTFYHSFFCGVGQFSNPYNLKAKDLSAWEFGKRKNKKLTNYTLGEMYEMPNSPYEQTLKKEAKIFITEYPALFIRNIFYRVGIMISPVLYKDGDFLPKSLIPYLFPLGLLLFPLWFLGLYYLYKMQKIIFWLSFTIYFYFFLMFGWFYVVGRVILPFLFINIFIYLFGIKFLIQKINKFRQFQGNLGQVS